MTAVKDMSTTTDPSNHKGYRVDDQENADYADLRIMPMWLWDPLQGRGFVLLRSA